MIYNDIKWYIKNECTSLNIYTYYVCSYVYDCKRGVTIESIEMLDCGYILMAIRSQCTTPYIFVPGHMHTHDASRHDNLQMVLQFSPPSLVTKKSTATKKITSKSI